MCEQDTFDDTTTVVQLPTRTREPPASALVAQAERHEREAIALYHHWIGAAIGQTMATPGTPPQRADRAMAYIRAKTGWRRLHRGPALRRVLRNLLTAASVRQDVHRAVRQSLPRAMKPLWMRERDGEVTQEERERADRLAGQRIVAELAARYPGSPEQALGR